jgi:hypothetical protein
MLSELTTLTQIGLLSHGYFYQPPRCSPSVDDSQSPGEDDEHDDDNADIQYLDSTDPSDWFRRGSDHRYVC